MERENHLPEDVHLNVIRRAVADSYRLGVCVSRQMVERLFLEGRLRADAVEDARSAVVQAALLQQPLDIVGAFVHVAHLVQDFHREAGVAQP